MGKLLSDEDEARFRVLWNDYAGRVQGTTGRSREDYSDEAMAPEVYVARAPEDGIPGLNRHGTGTSTFHQYDDEPGFAVCPVYRLSVDDEDVVRLKPMDFTKRVYNISLDDVQGNQWVLIAREKLGFWIAVWSSQGGGGTLLTVRGVGGGATVNPTSILEFMTAHGFVVSDMGGGVARVGLNRCDQLTIVSNVCPIFVEDDAFTGTGTGTGPTMFTMVGLSVEHTRVSLKDAGCPAIETWCVENPQDCCLVGTGTGTATGTFGGGGEF